MPRGKRCKQAPQAGCRYCRHRRHRLTAIVILSCRRRPGRAPCRLLHLLHRRHQPVLALYLSVQLSACRQAAVGARHVLSVVKRNVHRMCDSLFTRVLSGHLAAHPSRCLRCSQAVALIGAVVTGVLARRRRVEMQGLNTKLRQINSELRRQRDAQDAILAAISLAATPQAGAESDTGSSSSSSEGPEVAAALEALRLQREALQQERSVLEQALASPSAAHPTEGFGDQRRSLAHARRRIAKCIRWAS